MNFHHRVAGALVGLALVVAAHAAPAAPSISVSAHAGGIRALSGNPLSSSVADHRVSAELRVLARVRPGVELGVATGYDRLGRFGLPLVTAPEVRVSGERRVDAFHSTATVRLAGVRGVLRPYAMGSVGGALVRTDDRIASNSILPPGPTILTRARSADVGVASGLALGLEVRSKSWPVLPSLEGRWNNVHAAGWDYDWLSLTLGVALR